MNLSPHMRALVRAYDNFTNFAGGPDLPWVLDVYNDLDDATAHTMLWAFCYAWAAGQLATGNYSGSVGQLARELLKALPSWDGTQPRERKIAWLEQLGITYVLPEPETRPSPELAPSDPLTDWSTLAPQEYEAVMDMAAHFHIDITPAILLYRLGQALAERATTDIREAVDHD